MTFPDTRPAPPPQRFSSSDAAFEGFRLLREQPATVLAWSAAALALSLVMGLFTVGVFGAQMMRLTQLQALGRTAQPAAMLGAMSALAPFYLVTLVVTLGFYGLVNAAVNRAVLRPGEGGFGRFRLGAAELRQAGVILAIWLVLFATYLALAVGLAIAAVVGAMALHGAPPALGAVLLVLAGVGAFAALIYVMVRISLLSAATFDIGRLDPGLAWRLTRGRVWSLLGAYLLAWLMMAVVALIFIVIFVASAVVLGGGLAAAGSVFHPNMTSVGAFFGPVQLVYLVFSSILSGLYVAVFIGTPAHAYLQIAGRETTAETLPLSRGF